MRNGRLGSGKAARVKTEQWTITAFTKPLARETVLSQRFAALPL